MNSITGSNADMIQLVTNARPANVIMYSVYHNQLILFLNNISRPRFVFANIT